MLDCSFVLYYRVPLKVVENPIQNVKNMGGIRQRLQLRYSGATPGDAPEPLTNYLDVSIPHYSFSQIPGIETNKADYYNSSNTLYIILS